MPHAGEAPPLQVPQLLCRDKLRVAEDRLDVRRRALLQKPSENLHLILRRAATLGGNGRPGDRKRNLTVGHADHQRVDRGLTKVPLLSVDHGHIWRELWQETQQKLTEMREVQVLFGEEAADPAVIRRGLHARRQCKGHAP